MNTDTPETDANSERDICGIDSCDASFARNLERQRNKAIDECIALRQMVRELRDTMEYILGDSVSHIRNTAIEQAQSAITKANQLLP